MVMNLDDKSSGLNKVAKEIKVDLSHQQFNSEAELIDEIHLAKKKKNFFYNFQSWSFYAHKHSLKRCSPWRFNSIY